MFAERLHRSVVDYLYKVAKQDQRAGREPLQYAQEHKSVTTGRYCTKRYDFGLDNARFLKLLDPPTLYQIIPWDTGKQKPQVYLDRRYVAIEAPLPRHAQKYDVRLSELSGNRHNGRVCVLGPNEAGVTVSLSIEDIIHILIGGETGAGKTYTMRQLAYQLANGTNQIVLADGKRGDGLGILNGLPAQVGPIARDRQATLNALGWVYNEMGTRYDAVANRGGLAWRDDEPGAPRHIVAFVDEFQVYRSDVEIMAVMHALVSMGRSARVHVIAGTQKPTVKMFGKDIGGATRDQFGTRIAHWVQSYQASSAIVGDKEPRADYLLPKGDAYILGNTGSYPLCERVQIAYVPEAELYQHTQGGVPEMDAWPAFDASVLCGESGPGRPSIEFSNEQIACGIYAAQQPGWGRGRLQTLLDDRGNHIAGSDPVDRLLSMGREINDELDGISACLK